MNIFKGIYISSLLKSGLCCAFPSSKKTLDRRTLYKNGSCPCIVITTSTLLLFYHLVRFQSKETNSKNTIIYISLFLYFFVRRGDLASSGGRTGTPNGTRIGREGWQAESLERDMSG
jgi:hypothetical protein